MGNATIHPTQKSFQKPPGQMFMRLLWNGAILTGCIVSFSSGLALAKPVEVDSIAAIVNGEVITRSQVYGAAQMQVRMLAMEAQQSGMTEEQFRKKAEAMQKSALNTLIDRQLILSKFKEMGAQIRPQHVDESVDHFIRERFGGDKNKFIEELGKNGLSFKQFRDQQEQTIIVQAMRSREVGDQEPFVTPEEVADWYKKNKDLMFREDSSVRIRTITIPKTEFGDSATEAKQRALADEIYKKLKGGADFAAMARTNSVDSGAEKGGDRGTISKKDLAPELADQAFKMAVGSVSRPIELGGNFLCIMLLEARDLGRVAPLSEVNEEVRKRVLQNKRQEKLERFLTRLRRDANIKLFDEFGVDAVAAPAGRH